MAGILGYDPTLIQGGILGSAAPQMASWQQPLGIFSSALKDVGAYLSGRPSEANAVQQYGQQLQHYQMQQGAMQAVQAAQSNDPATSQQGYAAMVALGLDPSPIQKLKANAALPQLMQNLQPSLGFNDNPVGVTPAVNAGPGLLPQRQAAEALNAAPAMSMQNATLAGALQRTESPELTAELAPQLIQQQAQIAAKSVRPATVEEKLAGGYKPNDPVFIDAYKNLTSEVKPQAAIDQAANAPMTPYQRATLAAQASERAEKVREFNLTNPMAASGGGGGLSADISSYPPQVQSTVKAMLEGRQAPPTSFALSKPYWQNLMAIANAVDPTFDQTSWGARASARKDFQGGGKSYQLLNAGNTAIQHLGRLHDQIGDVSSSSIPLLNSAINLGSVQIGQPGVNAYNDTLGHLAEETTKFYRGTGGAEADIARNMENLSPNLSAAQKSAGVANTVHLIYGKLQPMVEQYNRTMGTNYPASHFLSAEAVRTIKKMGFDPDSGEATGQQQGAPKSLPSAQDLPRKGAKTIRFEDLP